MTTVTDIAETFAAFVRESAVGPVPDPDRSWDKVIGQLREIAGLEPGWDGDDAPAPPGPLVSSALALVSDLRRGGECPAPARAVASFDGTVVIEWQSTGFLAELEVVRPGHAEGTIHADGQETRHLSVGW